MYSLVSYEELKACIGCFTRIRNSMYFLKYEKYAKLLMLSLSQCPWRRIKWKDFHFSDLIGSSFTLGLHVNLVHIR